LDQLPDAEPESATKAGWTLAARSVQAFAASSLICHTKQMLIRSFDIPKAAARTFCVGRIRTEGGRPSSKSYRAGGELSEPVLAMADIAGGWARLRHARSRRQGVIDSKFGAVTLPRFNDKPMAHDPVSIPTNGSTTGQAAGFHATFKVLPALSRPVWPN
jgi:hypothetical protein